VPNLQSKLIHDNNITLVLDGQTHMITRGDPRWNRVVKALKANDYDDLAAAFAPKSSTSKFITEGFTVIDGDVYHDGSKLEPALAKVVLNLMNEGFDTEPYENFLANLQGNPSYRAREQLYGFIVANKITITDDGCLLLYKNVRSGPDGHYYDIHTGRICNDVGKTIVMDRTKVDDDPNRTCSSGLHVCSLAYLSHFPGDVTLLVKVDPADVVAIPVDYNNSKMRVCQYTVIDTHKGDYQTEATQSTVWMGHDDMSGDDYFADDVTSYDSNEDDWW
jgi:hypothetical protein